MCELEGRRLSPGRPPTPPLEDCAPHPTGRGRTGWATRPHPRSSGGREPPELRRGATRACSYTAGSSGDQAGREAGTVKPGDAQTRPGTEAAGGLTRDPGTSWTGSLLWDLGRSGSRSLRPLLIYKSRHPSVSSPYAGTGGSRRGDTHPPTLAPCSRGVLSKPARRHGGEGGRPVREVQLSSAREGGQCARRPWAQGCLATRAWAPATHSAPASSPREGGAPPSEFDKTLT